MLTLSMQDIMDELNEIDGDLDQVAGKLQLLIEKIDLCLDMVPERRQLQKIHHAICFAHLAVEAMPGRLQARIQKANEPVPDPA